MADAVSSVFTGLGLIVAYALLGSTWLILKTEGDLQARKRSARRQRHWRFSSSLRSSASGRRRSSRDCGALVQIAESHIFRAGAGPDPGDGHVLLLSLQQKAHLVPFIAALGLLFLGYSGLGISLWPHIVPPDLTIEAAAAPPQTQLFVLVGALIIIR